MLGLLRQALRGGAIAFAALFPLFVLAAAASADDAPAARPPGAAGLSGDGARMYGFVTTPHPGELAWQRIPWLTDLAEAVRQAKAEGRPLVLFVSGDEPLEKC